MLAHVIRHRSIPVLIALLVLSCQAPPSELVDEPPACEHVPSPATRFRLFAVGHKVTIDEAVSAETYEAAIRATVDTHVAPYLATDRQNVLVFPESVALSALLLGARGAQAREQETAVVALSLLLGEHAGAVGFYAQRAPLAAAGRLLLLAVSDPLWRAFDNTFSRLARDHGVYVVASLDIGDVEIATEDEIIAAVGDPDRPAGAPVYWVPDGQVYNQAVFYGPDGQLLARVRKQYLTDLEIVDLDLGGGLPERLGPVDVGGLMRAAAMISRDAWMQDALERQVLRGADVLMQNEAFSGGWTIAPQGYAWPPDNLKRSGWAAVQKHPELRVAVAPMLVGNFFDIVFDGQSFAAIAGEPGQTPGALIAQEPDTGWAAIAPWVESDPMTGTLEERRQVLRAVGEALLPGGERDNEYLPGSVYVDVELPADQGFSAIGDAVPGAETPVLGASVAIAGSGLGRQRHAVPVILAEGTMVVAWEDSRYCAGQIMVASSRDQGHTWTEPARVAPIHQAQRTPAMVATASGELILAWQQVTGADRAEIRVSRSSDGGSTWSPAVAVDAALTVEAWKPALAADPVTGEVHLAFVDRRAAEPDQANWRIYAARSDAQARSWSEAARVDPRERSGSLDSTYTNEWTPAIAARDRHVVVAYTHRQRPDPAEQPSHDVFAIHSRDGGLTWEEPLRLDQGGFPERLAADVVLDMAPEGELYVLWSSLRGTSHDSDIALAVMDGSTAAALSFAPDAAPSRDQWFPAVAALADGARVVAWQDFRNGSNDIYLARLDAQGFGAAMRVDDAGDSATQSWRPRIAAAPDGIVLVVWEDSRTGHAEIRAASGTLP
jgi:predicted amidohydrolase